MPATLQDIDEHSGFVNLTTLVESAPNTFTAAQIDDDEISPDIVLNAFGKGKHGMLVWEVKQWVVERNSMELINNTNTQTRFAIIADNSRDGEVPTAFIDADDGDYILQLVDDFFVSQAAAGEIAVHDPNRVQRINTPVDWLDGNNFGTLLTANHYHLATRGVGLVSAQTYRLGFWGRRVMVGITEAFFDQSAITELLLSAQILGLQSA